MSNFSFSHSVFCPFGEPSAIVIKFEIVVCKLFQVWKSRNLLCGKGLNVTQKIRFILEMSRKHGRKKRNCFVSQTVFEGPCLNKSLSPGFLILSQTTDFRLFHTETVCRRQF